LTAVGLFSFVCSVSLFIFGGAYKNDDLTRQKTIKNRVFIAAGVLLGVACCIGAYHMIYQQYYVATAILAEKDPATYMDLCTNLVESTRDTGIIDDFTRMKSERPIKEVQNFCGNMAKSTIGSK
jgi:uncharacterized membrane protein